MFAGPLGRSTFTPPKSSFDSPLYGLVSLRRSHLSAKRQKKIESRAAALIAEEMSLQELRKAHALAQQRVAEKLGIGQDGVSRLEKRSDVLISTLRGYVEAMGGELSLIAEFPGRTSIVLSGLATMEPATSRDDTGNKA